MGKVLACIIGGLIGVFGALLIFHIGPLAFWLILLGIGFYTGILSIIFKFILAIVGGIIALIISILGAIFGDRNLK